MWNRRQQGPLPELLLALTVVTGLVDAESILHLGRVFVANMTGNVVFVGFALAGAPGFSLSASLFALLGFLVGAGAGGVLITHAAPDRGRILFEGVAVELALAACALGVVVSGGSRLGSYDVDAAAGLLACAMGIQNAVARRLAVPDLTTTVLTMTLTGIAADLRTAERWPVLGRRALAVVTMFGGGVAGAELVLHGDSAEVLVAAVVLIGAVVLIAAFALRQPGEWRAPPK